MNRSHRLLLVLLAAVAVAVVGWRLLLLRAVAGEREQARAAHTEVVLKVERLLALRDQPPVSGYGSKPGDDVIQLTGRVMESATIPAARLRSVQPQSDSAMQNDRDGRRLATVRLSLEPLTVQELGAFLSAWRSSQQVWTVARIELSAMVGGGARVQGQYRASITVSASYIDDAPPPAQLMPRESSATTDAPGGSMVLSSLGAQP